MTAATLSVGIPEFGELAGHVASIAAVLPGPTNLHREALLRVAELMRGPTPSLAAAMHELSIAIFHLMPGGRAIDRPETWLVGACVALIKIEQVRLLGGVAAPGADILKS